MTALPPTPPRERGDAERLRQRLAQDLQSGRWQPGEKLPTERSLGERYGMARNTVRRALDALAAEGLIERHVGRGTFRTGAMGQGAAGAAAPAELDALPDAEAFGPAEVVECRLAFEPELVALAVSRASPADLARMEECLRHADAAADLPEFERWDGALHDAIAVATHNSAAIALSRSLARVRLQAEWGALKARGATPVRRAALQRQHRAIIAALRQRDRSAARRAMREHILYVQAYMFGEEDGG
ncbi:FadR/GntR family transcriptional regulator [Roseomonas sp. E05]|uniref:FadR/GntR family transcriptional regulator n=1 Tax=Roseomonas sp. E05 TaxID=3046310 RepID=UPI0024BAF224|nr:FadR/GntR family transcriptional regulator [Roseomonas sp. E05]MDJ0387454.1 FadR/GntR family transcriptional regulator [Roseomonas sp. E05]